MARQSVFDRQPAPPLTLVQEEATLRRPTGRGGRPAPGRISRRRGRRRVSFALPDGRCRR
ncbi:hypothetical protein [Streptomyces sp. NBC_00859]|uniref:hypothetical protein n=1 Tax=Streptomyces sp. NBC_00859 TaxID=2903682 RepID=UPI00386C4DA6